MNLLEIMMHRRSVRKYTGEEVPEEKLKAILQAALLSPSSRNKRSWEFILVKDKATIEKMSRCRNHGSSFLDGADKAIVVVGDSDLTDVWIEDCSIAMAHMYLMADSLGVGCCWIQGRNRVTPDDRSTDFYIKELLNIPEQYSLEAIMALGMPETHPESHSLEDLPYDKIHYEKF